MIAIENLEEISAVIHVHAVKRGIDGFGWGSVVVTSGSIIELSSGCFESAEPRLLLVACVESLKLLDLVVPVRIITNQAYVEEWVINRLRTLHDLGYRDAKGRNVSHGDVIRELYKLTRRRPFLSAQRVGRSEWTEHSLRAEELARSWGQGEGGLYPSLGPTIVQRSQPLLAVAPPSLARTPDPDIGVPF